MSRPRFQIRRAMDRALDLRVGTAAADVAAHRAIDLRVGRLRRPIEERRRRHHLPGLAVAALRHIDFDPRSLYRVAAIR
jgi:hypothetical protein